MFCSFPLLFAFVVGGLGFEFCVFVAGWRHALRSEWPFIIIIIMDTCLNVYNNHKCLLLLLLLPDCNVYWLYPSMHHCRICHTATHTYGGFICLPSVLLTTVPSTLSYPTPGLLMNIPSVKTGQQLYITLLLSLLLLRYY